jgi:hypothetical protein
MYLTELYLASHVPQSANPVSAHPWWIALLPVLSHRSRSRLSAMRLALGPANAREKAYQEHQISLSIVQLHQVAYDLQ